MRNFRDFGGHAAEGGRSVRLGVLYRSAAFWGATARDREILDGLGIAFQLDLRRPNERKKKPNRWPAAPVEVIANDDPVQAEAWYMEYLATDDPTPEGARRFMLDYYSAAPFTPRHVDLFRAWFNRLARADGAALVHCAAGKDRTGLVCALTLDLLGVARDDVIADYELSNDRLDWRARVADAQAQVAEETGRNWSEAVLAPFVRVEADYLEAAHRAMADKCGSVTGYMEKVLGVDATLAGQLRAHLRD